MQRDDGDARQSAASTYGQFIAATAKFSSVALTQYDPLPGKVVIMPFTTALLVSSTDLNWVGLRAILAGWPKVHVIDDVQQRELALPIAAREHPDLILVASDLLGVRIVPLVHDLHMTSPCSRVVVLGQPLEPAAHADLKELDVTSFVQWKTVTPQRIQLILAAVRAGEL